jgi:hypothetical protein
MLAYFAAAAVFLVQAGPDMLSQIHTYHPNFTWSLGVIMADRVEALRTAHLNDLAVIYRQMTMFSGLMILFSVIAGAAGPFLAKPQIAADPVYMMVLAVGGVFFYAAFSNGPVFADALFQAHAVPFNLCNIPAFWIGSLVLATPLIAWTVALVLHDLIASILLARQAPPPIERISFRR